MEAERMRYLAAVCALFWGLACAEEEISHGYKLGEFCTVPGAIEGCRLGGVWTGEACECFDDPDLQIDLCYEWAISDNRGPCPEGYGQVIVNTPNSDANPLKCKESFGISIACGRVATP